MKRFTTPFLLCLAAASLIAAAPSSALMQRIIDAADKDKDSKLSLEEFKPLDVQAKHHGEEHFKAGDKNGDGFIDAAELGAIDVYPTVLDLLGLAKPAQQHFDGISYAKVLKGEGQLDRAAYFTYFPHGGPNKAGGVTARSGDFKLIRWFGNPNTHELYNLREDLSEATDLAAKMPEKVKELDALIDGFLKDTGATYPRPNPAFQPTKTKP